MSKELFYAPQTYALALECGRKLMANESEEDKLVPVIHQMNTRIYNSAFCGIRNLRQHPQRKNRRASRMKQKSNRRQIPRRRH